MSSSFESIYKKLASSLEQGAAGQPHEQRADPARHISPIVAHELNNIITIIMGYSERLVLKNAGNPEQEAHLKLIVEASRRAATIVRDATPLTGIKPGANGVNGFSKAPQPVAS
ncbi:MAG TPA: histidine kinase dimerization/phospho-acceptor domain-containing protein [Verrucomicrobiae bacterium]|jgi:signal transduction histidine kinase